MHSKENRLIGSRVSRLVALLAAPYLAGCDSSKTLNPNPTVASVVVTPASGALAVGSSMQLAATVKDANGQPIPNAPVTWSSDNSGTATVSNDGLVRGLTTGT